MRNVTMLSLAFALVAGLAMQGCAKRGGAGAAPSDSTAVDPSPIRADSMMSDTTATDSTP